MCMLNTSCYAIYISMKFIDIQWFTIPIISSHSLVCTALVKHYDQNQPGGEREFFNVHHKRKTGQEFK